MFEYQYIGQVSYEAGLAAQADAFARVRDGSCRGVMIGLSHHPVMTFGRHAKLENLLMTKDWLSARGVAVAETDRGGDVTYHGPEQVLLYPVVALERAGWGVKSFAGLLEETMVRYLAALGIDAKAGGTAPGVYRGHEKLGFLGLRVREGISTHGLSLNLGGSLEPFSWMNPCGQAGLSVTSVERVLGRPAPSHEAAAAGLAQGLCELLEARPATGGRREDSRVSGERDFQEIRPAGA